MLTSIIWATDGSDYADHALPFVEQLARAFSATITVVHVDQRLVGRAGGYPVYADEPEIKEKIRQQTARLAEAGFDVTCRVITGTVHAPADLIADVARELDADLIVVGSHGHGFLTAALAGSVTTRLLHVAPCPVFAVPARVPIPA
ncbi:MAG TPA: universal stress protein [Acidimicrobiales bacterium]|nr:universal stress protein [Acidimicrobiales bacterium]